MNQPSPSVGFTIVSYAVKVVITFVAVIFFLMLFGMLAHVHQLMVSAQAGLKNLPSLFLNKPAANTRNPSVHPFWPEFPHSVPGYFQTLVINGIQVMTEQWDCGSSPDDVLSYYREQMTARGWRDATEQAYKLQPELRGTTGDLQSKSYIDVYRQIMNSTVVLNRGDWTMRVSAEPSNNGFHQITVKIFAAATPSLDTLSQQLMATMGKDQAGQPLDVVQDSAGEHYHTVITTTGAATDAAMQQKLSELSALGWKEAIFLPKKMVPNGGFVWLIRGKQYGALSVSALQQGRGSSITFTEVTPH